MQIKSKSKSESEKESTVHYTLNEAERLTLSGLARNESSGVEKDFIEEVGETMAAYLRFPRATSNLQVVTSSQKGGADLPARLTGASRLAHILTPVRSGTYEDSPPQAPLSGG